jgi:hypothetical protein
LDCPVPTQRACGVNVNRLRGTSPNNPCDRDLSGGTSGFAVPSAKCPRICAVVHNVLCVRMIPSAISPHGPGPLLEHCQDIDRYIPVLRCVPSCRSEWSRFEADAPFTNLFAADRHGLAGAGQWLAVHRGGRHDRRRRRRPVWGPPGTAVPILSNVCLSQVPASPRNEAIALPQ